MSQSIHPLNKYSYSNDGLGALIPKPSPSPSSPQASSLQKEDNIYRKATDMYNSSATTIPKMLLGPSIASGIALNFFVLFAVFNTLNILNLDKVRSPNQVTTHTKDSVTYGGVASVVNGIIGLSWSNLVGQPYMNTVKKIFSTPDLNEDTFENIKNSYKDFFLEKDQNGNFVKDGDGNFLLNKTNVDNCRILDALNQMREMSSNNRGNIGVLI